MFAAPPIIQKLVIEASSLWSQDFSNRDEARVRYEMADGDAASKVPSMPHETVRHRSYRPATAPRLLGWMMDELAYLYTSPPRRITSTPLEWRAALYENGFGINSVMHRTHWLARLAGMAAATTKHEGPGKFIPYAVPRHNLSATVDIAGQPTMVIAQSSSPAAWDAYPEYEVWTKEFAFKVQGNASSTFMFSWDQARPLRADMQHPGHRFNIEAWRNIHGRIPYALAFNRVTDAGCGIPYGMGGIDLKLSILGLIQLIQQYDWCAMMSRGTKTITSVTEEKPNIVEAPDAWTVLSQGQVANVLKSGADLPGIKGAIESTLWLICLAIGVPAGAIGFAPGQGQSSIYVDAQELRKDRPIQARLMAGTERTLHENVATQDGTRLDPSVYTAYTQPQPPLDPAQQDARARLKADLGLATRAELLAIFEPHLSLQELDVKVEAAAQDAMKFALHKAWIAGRLAQGPA